MTCKHQFWKDRNPPGCMNCGMTERELVSIYKNMCDVPDCKDCELTRCKHQKHGICVDCSD